MEGKGIADIREATHGSWKESSAVADSLTAICESKDNWKHMTSSQKHALRSIIVKMSRILSGNPNTVDHWADIEGYAHLAKVDLNLRKKTM